MNDADRAFIDALTCDQVEASIREAIRDREFAVVPGMIKVLALKDPRRAQLVLNALELATAIRDQPEASVIDLALATGTGDPR